MTSRKNVKHIFIKILAGSKSSAWLHLTRKRNKQWTLPNISNWSSITKALSIRWKIPVSISGSFQWRMKQHCSEFPEKRTTLRSIPKFAKIPSVPGISVSFDLLPGILRLSDRMVRFSKIQQFPDFLETFSGNFRTFCPRYENFRMFVRMEISLSFRFERVRNTCRIQFFYKKYNSFLPNVTTLYKKYLPKNFFNQKQPFTYFSKLIELTFRKKNEKLITQKT